MRGDVGDVAGVVVADEGEACVVEHGAGNGDGDGADAFGLALLARLHVPAIEGVAIGVQAGVEGLLGRVAGDGRDQRVGAVGGVRLDLVAGAGGPEDLVGLQPQR
jgi:hypothetical protein